MKREHHLLLAASLATLCVAGLAAAPLAAQDKSAATALPANAPPTTMRLTLEEAKQRALANNKLLQIGTLNSQGKGYAIRAAQADYFPKVTGFSVYSHFNDNLGTVIATQGRTVSGPLLGKPLLTLPATTIDVPVLNQNSSFSNIGFVQPITDLLKVRQGVKLAQADQQIAQAQLEKGIREVASGVEQLYWGLLAASRIRAGAAAGVRGAEMLAAKMQTLEVRTALLEARQGLQQVDKQIADLQEQLDGLLDLPLCTTLELVEPALPILTVRCADEAIALALAASPEIHEAEQTILKAQAALTAGKLDFVPSIAAVGGYVNQTGASYIQQNIGYVGVVGAYTFVDGGKRRSVIHERQTLVAMASLKLHQTQDDMRQKTQKAFRELTESQESLKTAQEMVELRKEAAKNAMTPEALRNPTTLLTASKNLTLAEFDAVKADLAYRQAYVQLMSLMGKE